MPRALPILIAALILGAGGSTSAQHVPAEKKTGPAVKVLSSADVEEEVGGKKAKATTFEVTFEPGAAGTRHRHPGPV